MAVIDGLDGKLAGFRYPSPSSSPSMGGSRKSSKIYIPHTVDEGCNIVGILEQLGSDGDTQGRPIALVQSSSPLFVWEGTERAFAF